MYKRQERLIVREEGIIDNVEAGAEKTKETKAVPTVVVLRDGVLRNGSEIELTERSAGIRSCSTTPLG